jgi:hypothetical protein
MNDIETRNQLWPAARVTFIGALLLFVITVVIGILNGLDLYEPDHDTLITHVHAGTLGWITLAVSGAALLMFGGDRHLTDAEVAKGQQLAWAMTGAIALYVAAFLIGDRIPGDRIQRPIVGTILFVVVVWFAVWLFRSNREAETSSVARLGLLLAWVALLIGAVLGVLLGIYTSQGEIPGLADETAAAVAEGHPPAMVIGFLILAAMAIIEWLLRGHTSWSDSKSGSAQMWILFAAGLLANVGFIARLEEELLGPANLLMIIGVIILVVRYRSELLPSGWRGAGTGLFARISSVFLVVYLVLGTILIARVVSGAMDFDALTEAELGLVLAFDHTMFVGVMTNLLFGVMAVGLHGSSIRTVDRILLWGINIGVIGFIVGLLTVSPVLKRISTPVMGTAILVGIAMYLTEMTKNESRPSVPESS